MIRLGKATEQMFGIKNINTVLLWIFYGLLLVFPFIISGVYILVCLCGGWERIDPLHTLEWYSIPELNYVLAATGLITITIFCITQILKMCFSRTSCASKKFNKIIILVISLMFLQRFLLLILYKGEMKPFSDFASAWERAKGVMDSLYYYRFFPGYINFSLYFKLIISIFGENFDIILLLNIIYNMITAIMIYKLVIVNDLGENIAILAMLIYIFDPSAIVYTFVATPEHLAIMCFIVAIYLLIKVFVIKTPKDIALIVVASFFLGIGNSLKTFSPIIIIAYIIAKMLYLMKQTSKLNFDKILFLFLSITILVGGTIAVNEIVTSVSEKVFDVTLNSSDAIPHYLLVGLNIEGEGQIHIGTQSRTYIQERVSGVSLEEAKDHAIQVIKDGWGNNILDVLKLMVNKTIWAWQDNLVPILYFNKNLSIIPNTFLENCFMNFSNKILPTYAEIWYFCVMLLAAYGCVCSFKEKRYLKNHKFLFGNLIIMGYFCMMLILEAQSRYKCLIMPYICVIAAVGAFKICYKNENVIDC